MSITTRSVNRGDLIKWLITVAAPLLFFLIPTSESFSAASRMFVVTSVMAILVMAFGLLDNMIPALLLPAAWWILGVVETAPEAYAGFGTVTIWVILGAYVLTIALDDCGILKRIALFIIEKLGGSYNATLYAIYIVGVILGQLCFCSHYFILIGLVFGICQAMHLKPYSKAAVIMMGVGGMGAMNVKTFLYQTSNMTLMINGMRNVFPDFNITPLQLLLYNCPEFVTALLFIFLMTKVCRTKDIQFEGGKEYFRTERQKMGPMSAAEKKAIVVLVVLMAYVMGQPLHGFDLNYVFIVLPWICFFPGVNIAPQKSLDKVKMFFSTFAFAGTCIGIGQVAQALGFGDLISEILGPTLGGLGKVGLTYGVLIFGAFANLLLSPAAMASLLPIGLGNIYHTLGYPPICSVLTVNYSLDMIFLPHEVTAYLVLFGFGMMKMKHFIAFFGAKTLFTLVMFGLIQIPWWHLLGIF